MSRKRERSPSAPPAPATFHSSKIVDSTGTSSFLAAFSPTLSVKALQALPEFSTASHRIAAWRKRSKQRSLMPESKILYDLGHDDDGEKYAGSRLQHVLADTQTEGTLVCARWYGGQNIGPIRFTHIEDCAKQALWECKINSPTPTQQEAAKKQKLEEEATREGLEKNLRERDLNIFVLRKLLADKKRRLDGKGMEEATVPLTPQKPPPDYGGMSLEALGRVDKARDATIAFILKQIDKVDEELKAVDEAQSWRDAEEARREQSSPKEDPQKTGEES